MALSEPSPDAETPGVPVLARAAPMRCVTDRTAPTAGELWAQACTNRESPAPARASSGCGGRARSMAIPASMAESQDPAMLFDEHRLAAETRAFRHDTEGRCATLPQSGQLQQTRRKDRTAPSRGLRPVKASSQR
jgi:hypothetical protein